jgi:hypothetical protein
MNFEFILGIAESLGKETASPKLEEALCSQLLELSR